MFLEEQLNMIVEQNKLLLNKVELLEKEIKSISSNKPVIKKMFVDAKQAAEIIGIKPRTLITLRERGDIVYTATKPIMYDPESCVAYLERQSNRKYI